MQEIQSALCPILLQAGREAKVKVSQKDKLQDIWTEEAFLRTFLQQASEAEKRVLPGAA